jgi:RNA polymerase sigma factor (sigma-70 family)
MALRLLNRGSKPISTELSLVSLLHLCAENKDDSNLWSELLRRVIPKIKQYIRATLRQSKGSGPTGFGMRTLWGVQESDLLQSAIIRLIKNDCAAIKRFTGGTEADLFAYLAVITRSVVRDWLRRQRAKKRSSGRELSADLDSWNNISASFGAGQSTMEREVLGREVMDLSERFLGTLTGRLAERDTLIFHLYFRFDLSTNQIAQCKGINLSKQGVEKVIRRLVAGVRAAASAGPREAKCQ